MTEDPRAPVLSLSVGAREGRDSTTPSPARGTSGPSPPDGPSCPPRRCAGTSKKTGGPCTAYPVRGEAYCAGHSGRGLARAPSSYARLGVQARRRRNEAAEEEKRGTEALETLKAALESGKLSEDPLMEARARQAVERRTLSAKDAEHAAKLAETVAEKEQREADEEQAFLERFIARQLEINSDFDYATWAAANARTRAESAARRKRQARSEQAVADRELSISSMPKLKPRRRPTYVWRRYGDGGPGYESYRRRGNYTTPVSLI